MKNKTNDDSWNPQEHYKDIKVAKEYDQARFSSLAGRVFNNQEKKIILECFQDIPSDTVILDMPCGTGRLAGALLESGSKVHGVDVSAEMLEVAQERLVDYSENFTTEVKDAFNMTGNEGKFETALCARVLMHFPLKTQIEFLRGVASITRKRIVINHSLNSPYQRFRRWIKKLLGHQESVGFPVTNSEIGQLLSEVGFVEIKRKRINSFVSEAVYIIAERKQ